MKFKQKKMLSIYKSGKDMSIRAYIRTRSKPVIQTKTNVQHDDSSRIGEYNFTCNKSLSFSKENTSDPTMLEHVFKQNIVRINGSLAPCVFTIIAICITGSTSGVGKIPAKGDK